MCCNAQNVISHVLLEVGLVNLFLPLELYRELVSCDVFAVRNVRRFIGAAVVSPISTIPS